MLAYELLWKTQTGSEKMSFVIYDSLHRERRDEWSLSQDRKQGCVEWRHEGKVKRKNA